MCVGEEIRSVLHTFLNCIMLHYAIFPLVLLLFCQIILIFIFYVCVSLKKMTRYMYSAIYSRLRPSTADFSKTLKYPNNLKTASQKIAARVYVAALS